MYPFPHFHASAGFDPAPAGIRTLRRRARMVILAILWAAPAAIGGLAARGGMEWELVSLLAATATAAASLFGWPGRRGRLVLAASLAVATGLALGAGQSATPPVVALVGPVAALALGGALCDRRALMAALGVLAVACLLPLGAAPAAWLPLAQTGVLAIAAVLIVVAQQGLRHAARAAETMVLPPPPRLRPAAPVWSAMAPAPPPGLMLQAERTPDGTLRLAVAGNLAGVLRVSVADAGISIPRPTRY